jgi:hypothetical protein
MRVLLILALCFVAAAAENPVVALFNLTRPLTTDFQIGDRVEIRVMGAPNQQVSVRTTRRGRTDWGPVIASTDSAGRWSTFVQLKESDFGDWNEIWTVAGRVAAGAIRFFVQAPCLPGGQGHAIVSGPNLSLSCDTAEGSRTFTSAPASAPMQTPEEYPLEILEHFITSEEIGAAAISLQSSRGGLGDETADLIGRLIGSNGLTDSEIRHVLTIIRAAFEKPDTIAPAAKQPANSLRLLRHLDGLTGHERLKQEIAATIAYLQAR